MKRTIYWCFMLLSITGLFESCEDKADSAIRYGNNQIWLSIQDPEGNDLMKDIAVGVYNSESSDLRVRSDYKANSTPVFSVVDTRDNKDPYNLPVDSFAFEHYYWVLGEFSQELGTRDYHLLNCDFQHPATLIYENDSALVEVGLRSSTVFGDTLWHSLRGLYTIVGGGYESCSSIDFDGTKENETVIYNNYREKLCIITIDSSSQE